MSETTTVSLTSGASRFLDSLPDTERGAIQAEVQRFVRWAGPDRLLVDLRAQEVANYGESLTGTMRDAGQRAEAVRKFLAFAAKKGLTGENMAKHLRVRKVGGQGAAPRGAIKEVQLTEREKAALEAELAELKAQRPRIRSDIQRAMADKDFRENAPLDAAKQEQALVEGRIRAIEANLANVVIVEEAVARAGEAIGVGSTVVLVNLATSKETRYTLVRPSDVNPAQGRISADSPVGRALVEKRAGEEVDVEAPSGTIRFRISNVE
jgi:transcription elongation factor GreA